MPVNSFDNYPMSWKPDKNSLKSPYYKSLAQLLENDIKNGLLKPGDKLPPQRELADFLDLNLSTITRAFKYCNQKGLISGTIGKGTYISTDAHVSSLLYCRYSTPNNYIDMGPVYPIYSENSYITDMTRKLLKSVDMNSYLKYTEPQGVYSHRITGQKYLKKYNVDVTPDDIIIASGSQNALSIILTSLFNPGDKIAVTPLTYPGFKTLAKMLGIILIPIPLIDGKIDADSLLTICKNEKIKGIYLIPNLNNPTTHEMTYEEKLHTAEIVKQHNMILIEDGLYSYINSSDYMPLYSFIPSNSIYIGSVSKSLCPGLRISFMASPPKYRDKIINGVYNIDIMTSPFNAEIICQLIETNLSSTIIEKKNKITKIRNRIADNILQHNVSPCNPYSPFRWLPLPEHVDSKNFENLALENGVQVYCASRFAVGNSQFSPGIRFSVCSPSNIDELKKGLYILKSLIEKNN